ncbi:MAG: hypothetical protein WC667_12465 [Sulfurimonas sp.]|jgi:hypothetical protein
MRLSQFAKEIKELQKSIFEHVITDSQVQHIIDKYAIKNNLIVSIVPNLHKKEVV